jgi:hypothetical protein
MSHPGGPGGQWVHGARRCGQRFQSGHAPGVPCTVTGCGFDSLATCQGGCRRRVCYAHAGVCPWCQAERAARVRQREEAEAAARRAAVDKANAALRNAVSIIEVRDCLVQHEAEPTPTTYLSVWRDLVVQTVVPDVHFVAIRERTGFDYSSWRHAFWRFVEESRAPGWSAGEDRWLDSEGTLYGPRSQRHHMLFGGSSTVALQANAAFLPRRSRGEWISDGRTVDRRHEQEGELGAAILACVGRAIQGAGNPVDRPGP